LKSDKFNIIGIFFWDASLPFAQFSAMSPVILRGTTYVVLHKIINKKSNSLLE
jgi:hypothetical protein